MRLIDLNFFLFGSFLLARLLLFAVSTYRRTDKTEHKMIGSSKFWTWGDRILLVCVLSLQVAILMSSDGNRPVVSGREADTVHGRELRPSLSRRPAARTNDMAVPKSAAFTSDERFSRMLQQASRLNADGAAHEQAFSRMETFFEQAVRDFDRLRYLDRDWESLVLSPAMDMRDKGDNYVVSFCVPGANARDIDVVLKGRLLSIDVLMSQDKANRKMYQRRVMLPGAVGPSDEALAILTNGMLRIFVPKCLDTPGKPATTVVAYRLL